MLTEVTIKLTIKSLPILVLYNGSFKLLVGCSTKILHVLERNISTNSIEVLLNVFLLIMEKKKKGGGGKKTLLCRCGKVLYLTREKVQARMLNLMAAIPSRCVKTESVVLDICATGKIQRILTLSKRLKKRNCCIPIWPLLLLLIPGFFLFFETISRRINLTERYKDILNNGIIS